MVEISTHKSAIYILYIANYRPRLEKNLRLNFSEIGHDSPYIAGSERCRFCPSDIPIRKKTGWIDFMVYSVSSKIRMGA